MKITVILCTYNRSQSLTKALESVAASTLPSSVAWEVLVVDNNSSDQTREVVEECCSRHPGRFRYLFESQPGKSHALNAGIREARGDVLAFMDDDVTVEATWLQNLTAALQDSEWGGAGGRILPEPAFSPPLWLSFEGPKGRYALAPLALFDLGPGAGQLAEAPFGTNMAFRKEMFEKYGSFRTDLGPRPGSEIRNEDTEFGSRLLAAGERLSYEPSAVVYHPVQENRIQKKYFLAWWFDKGRADIRQFGIRPDAMWCWGIPLYLFCRFVVWTLRWMVTLEPHRRFSRKLTVWGKAGEILECYRRPPGARRQRSQCSAQS
jgi:glycosyltransferase involved in cell wall biosynthesis